MTAAEARALFLRELPTIERVISAACARSRFSPTDLEDVAAALRLKLIENNYAVIRQFEGKSAFSTFLTIVVQRAIIDQRNHRWGRWIPSAEATRLGPRAVALETMLHRDGQTLEEAFRTFQSNPSLSLTRTELDELARKLPRRLPRATTLSLNELSPAHDIPSQETPELRLFARERERLGESASRILDDTIASLPPEDRLLLRMRFEEELSVAHISRATGEDQRKLYYRIERLALTMRKALEEAGVDRDSAAELVASGAATLSLASFGNPASHAPMGGGTLTPDNTVTRP